MCFSHFAVRVRAVQFFRQRNSDHSRRPHKNFIISEFRRFSGISFCFSCSVFHFALHARSRIVFPFRGIAFITLLLEFLIIMILKAFRNERNRLCGREIASITFESNAISAMTETRTNKCVLYKQEQPMPTRRLTSALRSVDKRKAVPFYSRTKIRVFLWFCRNANKSRRRE